MMREEHHERTACVTGCSLMNPETAPRLSQPGCCLRLQFVLQRGMDMKSARPAAAETSSALHPGLI
eukprot:1674818-Rhodomonas_salina.1